jgi:general secretion pathway protein D
MGPRGLVACLLTILLALAADAAPRNRRGVVGARTAPLGRTADGQHILRFDRTPITEVIEQVSRITGQAFLFDPTISGQVTIQVPEPVDEAEALQILNTALLMHGYLTVIIEGGMRKIVRVEGFAGNAPLLEGEPRPYAGELVTTLVRLETADPERVAAAIRPLMATTGLIIPYPATRSLILASTERRLHRLLGIVRDLDSAGELNLVVLALRYRDAQEVAGMIAEAMPPRPGETDVEKVIASDYSNSLIVQATPARIERIREFIDEVDLPPVGRGQLHVVPILHTDPERLATALESLAGRPSSPVGGTQSGDSSGLEEYSVVVHAPSRSLIIQADPATYRRLSEVIAKLDREEPRISVELIVFEVQVEKSFELGIDLIAPVTGSRAADDLNSAIVVNNTSADILATAAGIPQQGVVTRFVGSNVLIPIMDGAGNVITTLGLPAAHIMAEERNTEISVLQRPHLLVINGEDQELSVGNNIPVPVSSQTNDSNPLEVRQNIERYDVGINIRIGATVGQEGPVRLHIDLEQSSLAPSVAGSTARVGPTIRTRTLMGTVYLEDGETAVIGGLVSPRSMSGTSKVPFLGDVPAIGALFRATRQRVRDVHMMVAVSATVLKTREEDQLETIRRRTAFERNLSDLHGLREVTDSRYALLVSSHRGRQRAEADADNFLESPYRAEIVEWEYDNNRRFDVYLTGFDEFAQAASASHAVRAAGWTPRVVVVDKAMPR